MKQVVKVRVLPTQDQAAALEATLNTCNAAASWLSGRVHAERLCDKHTVQEIRALDAAGDPGDRQGRRRLYDTAGQYQGRQLRPARIADMYEGGGHADRLSC
ncbi:MAG TPA: hypothetical protein VLZ05_18280 [Mycobacterium sp.]|nr:hypothetical protein [Mycobacterium sp.]HUH70636.1 hypothetical protein [Mycobacterium sp.]